MKQLTNCFYSQSVRSLYFFSFSSSYERENIEEGKLIIINIIVSCYDWLLINFVFQWMSENNKWVNCQIYMLDFIHDHDCCCD